MFVYITTAVMPPFIITGLVFILIHEMKGNK